jgi:hypothetical protein
MPGDREHISEGTSLAATATMAATGTRHLRPMTNGAWLTILILTAIIVVGLATAYLPLQTAAEIMAGAMVIGAGVLGYIAQGRR